MQNESAYWLAWSKIPRVGPILLKRMWQQFNSLETAWKATPEALGKIEGFGPKLINTIQQQRSQINPPELLKQHLQKNPQFWTPSDDNYPRLLLEIPSPPPLLYYQGQVNLLENKEATALSIVNSKVTLLEHITEKKESESKKDVVLENYNKQDKDTRLLTYKVLLEKFNSYCFIFNLFRIFCKIFFN